MAIVSLAASIALASLGMSASRVSGEPREHAMFHENVLGTSLELRIWGGDSTAAAAAERRTLDEIDRLAKVLSTYDPESELSRWRDARREVSVSRALMDVLSASDRWRRASNGAFDPRVALATRVWKRADGTDRGPTSEALALAREPLTRDAWSLDEAGFTAQSLSNDPLSLDAIAKGYIVEQACEAAYADGAGVSGVLINLGGDMRARGEIDPLIGIARGVGDSESTEPAAYLRVRDCSVATSGRQQRGFRIGGRWYSHIIDPRSGMPVEGVVSATVIARRGADADALATICNVLEPGDSVELVDSLADAACRIELRNGEIVESARWASYECAAPLIVDDPKATGESVQAGAWPDTHELAIDFEINRPETAGRYRRPYVVVWVENAEGVSVRTLLLWVSLGGSGPDQWLPDLARWYRGDSLETSAKRKNMVQTIGRPTRPPGQYSVIWDGKDSAGKLVADGDYTIFIEAAREHGTHQLMRKQLHLEAKDLSEDVAGNVEIKGARIQLRQRSKAE